LLLVFFKLNY